MKYAKRTTWDLLGRNGYAACCGVTATPMDQEIWIEPLTSRGTSGRCRIPVPVAEVDTFIDELRAAAAEIKVQP